jgi:hypothetical protein
VGWNIGKHGKYLHLVIKVLNKNIQGKYFLFHYILSIMNVEKSVSIYVLLAFLHLV